MFYNFDINKWILILLPPILRRPVLYALIRAMLAPLAEVYTAFLTSKGEAERQMTSNAFTIYLERFLNGLFYLPDGAIYITDFVDEEMVYFAYATEESDPVYVGNKDDEDSLYLISTRPDAILGGFTVNIPESIDKPEYISVIDKWVNYYKYAGTSHIIKSYHG